MVDSCMLSDRRQLLHSVVGTPLVTVDDGTISQMPLYDGEECLRCSVRDGHHHSQCWRLAGIDHPEHPHFLCCRTPSMVFGLMSEQALVDLNNNSWSSKHQWGVNIDNCANCKYPSDTGMPVWHSSFLSRPPGQHHQRDIGVPTNTLTLPTVSGTVSIFQRNSHPANPATSCSLSSNTSTFSAQIGYMPNYSCNQAILLMTYIPVLVSDILSLLHVHGPVTCRASFVLG